MSSEPSETSGAVDAGVFVGSVVLLVASILKGWTVLGWLSGAVLIGVMVTTAARRQLRDGDRRGGDGGRPWRRDE